MSDYDTWKTQSDREGVDDRSEKEKYYQPRTGARCGCKRGVQRDNCPNCEGTGWVIDFATIRARSGR